MRIVTISVAALMETLLLWSLLTDSLSFNDWAISHALVLFKKAFVERGHFWNFSTCTGLLAVMLLWTFLSSLIIHVASSKWILINIALAIYSCVINNLLTAVLTVPRATPARRKIVITVFMSTPVYPETCISGALGCLVAFQVDYVYAECWTSGSTTVCLSGDQDFRSWLQVLTFTGMLIYMSERNPSIAPKDDMESSISNACELQPVGRLEIV